MALKIGWAPLILGALASASCAEAKERARPSLLADLPQMAPVIACIDTAPLDDEAAVKACVAPTGLSFEKTVPEPKSLNDFRTKVLLFWMASNRGPDRAKNSGSFLEAIDYARCVERAAYADRDFSSKTRSRVEVAQLRSELACNTHPLSLYRQQPNAGTASPDIFTRMFAKVLASLAMHYALEANGWFPDAMRPCVRYTDGRPPSAGCANERPAPAPPPPK